MTVFFNLDIHELISTGLIIAFELRAHSLIIIICCENSFCTRYDLKLLTQKYLAGVRSVIFQTTNGWILAKLWVSNTSLTRSLWAHFANFSILFGWFWLILEKQTRLKIADGCCQQFSNVPVSIIKIGLPFVKWKSVRFRETKSGFKLHIFRFGET